jgi:hypothetical protein
MLQLIDQYKQQYSESPRDRKRPIVEEIIALLTQDGGRFLKRYNEDVNSTWWVEVTKQVAFDKVSHAFRSRGRPKADKSSALPPSVSIPTHGHPGAAAAAMGMMNPAAMSNPAMMAAAMGRGMMNPAAMMAAARGYPPRGGQFSPAEMAQLQYMDMEQRRAAALGFGNAAALYGAGFAGPGDGGFGLGMSHPGMQNAMGGVGGGGGGGGPSSKKHPGGSPGTGGQGGDPNGGAGGGEGQMGGFDAGLMEQQRQRQEALLRGGMGPGGFHPYL